MVGKLKIVAYTTASAHHSLIQPIASPRPRNPRVRAGIHRRCAPHTRGYSLGGKMATVIATSTMLQETISHAWPNQRIALPACV